MQDWEYLCVNRIKMNRSHSKIRKWMTQETFCQEKVRQVQARMKCFAEQSRG